MALPRRVKPRDTEPTPEEQAKADSRHHEWLLNLTSEERSKWFQNISKDPRTRERLMGEYGEYVFAKYRKQMEYP